MSNIEVGEYIRSKGGCIFKATEYWITECAPDRQNIKTHSKSIIDLIEDKDIVIIKYITYYGEEMEKLFFVEIWGNVIHFFSYFKQFAYDKNQNKWLEDIKEKSINIKSIVTKEQFKEMEYRINE